MGNELRKVT